MNEMYLSLEQPSRLTTYTTQANQIEKPQESAYFEDTFGFL